MLLSAGNCLSGHLINLTWSVAIWGPKASRSLHRLRNALRAKDMIDFMAREGADPVGSTPQELHTLFEREVAKYAKVIKTANIVVQ